MACEPTYLEALETLKLAGNKHFAAGRHAEALRHYTAALELPPAAADDAARAPALEPLCRAPGAVRRGQCADRRRGRSGGAPRVGARVAAPGARGLGGARRGARAAFERGAACEGGAALAADLEAAAGAVSAQAFQEERVGQRPPQGASGGAGAAAAAAAAASAEEGAGGGDDAACARYTPQPLHSLAQLHWLPPDAARAARATPGTLPGPPSLE
jgi:hypothetical protein